MEKNGKIMKNASDVGEFAGKIVVYRAVNFSHILAKEIKWPKPKEYENLNFGYIPTTMTSWSSGETSYNMAIFKGMDEVVSNCALTDEWVRDAGLTMREATKEEIKVLREIYDSGKGIFEYRDWPIPE
ncbi:MAG: hypothetical protein PHQ20_02885 [Candidatus Moranbacteria bacterium]|nr:hypothetical protein [Candidatus Moranbacteria bacterium]